MPARNTVEVIITAKDRASDVIRGVAGNLQSIGKAAVGIAAGGLAAGTAAVGSFANHSVQQFASFEQGMNEVFTLLPGISGQAMDQMEYQVSSLANNMGVLPEKAVPALYQALSAGVPRENVFEFLETAQMAAAGGVTDLTTAVDGISSVVNSYGDQISGATEASDLMFTAVKLGKTNFEELSASLFNVVPTASSLGVEFQDVTAAMATLTSQGVPTSVATTQLRQAFVELSDSGSDVSKAFKEEMGESFRDFIAGGGNTVQAMEAIQRVSEKTGTPINEMFSSIEAVNAVLGLTGDNAETFRDNLLEMGDAAGATEAAHEQMNQGLMDAWTDMQAAAQNLANIFGGVLAPAVEPVIRTFTAFIKAISSTLDGGDYLNDFLTHIPKPLRGIGLAITKAVAFFYNLTEVFRITAEEMDGIMPWFTALRVGILEVFGMGALQLYNDFVGVIRTIHNAIVTLMSPITAFVQRFVEWKDVLIVLGAAVASFLIPAIVSLGATVVAALAPVIATFAGLVAAVALVRTAWEENFGGIRDALVTAWSRIQPVLAEVASQIMGMFSGGDGEGAAAFASGIMTALEGIVSFVSTRVIPVLTDMAIWIIEKIPPAFQFVQTVWDAVLKPAFQGIRDFIQNQVIPRLQDFADWFTSSGLPQARDFVVNQVLPKMQEFFNFIRDAWDNIRPKIQAFADWFLVNGLPAIRDFIVNQVQPKVEAFFNFIQGAWDQIRPRLQLFADWFLVDALPSIRDLIVNDVQPVIEEWVDYIANIWDTVSTGLGNFANWFSNEGGLGAILDFLGGQAADAFETFIGIVEDLMGVLGDALNDVNEFINAWQEGGVGGAVSKGKSNIGQAFSAIGGAIGAAVGGNRFGGNVSAGTPTVVGEGGRELFVPSTDGRIVPNGETEAMLGNQSITINNNFTGTMSREDIRQASRDTVNSLRAEGFSI